MGWRDKRPAEAFASGILLAGAFVALWAFGGHSSWMLLAAIFAGVIPASKGLSGLIAERAQRREIERSSEPKKLDAKGAAAAREKSVLRIARDKGGRLTPPLVALESDLSLEEAERALDELAKKGHASMVVREDGRVEYEFSEFLPL
jgi:Uncharacterized membrane-associated protein/domain